MKKTQMIRWMIPIAALAVLLASCSEDKNPADYKTHPTGWNNTNSENFHGLPALQQEADCQGCHGADWRGGTTSSSCYDCHTILHNDVSIQNPNEHVQYIVAENWNIQKCELCHGEDFRGAASGFACTTCHTAPAGPADCRTCHGMPPVDNNTVLTGMAAGSAGAHLAHLRFACTECHATVTGLGHVGALPADVVFTNAQIAKANDFSPIATHEGDIYSGNASCATVYCHSNGSGGAPVLMPEWVGGGLSCGGCHRMPPDRAGHPQVRTCHNCHSDVDPNSDYSTNDGIVFLDESKHVNGVVD
ncbi:MAG: CxxxxCH/CxxCH domain c-type cytochrome [Calditrichota bacterium]